MSAIYGIFGDADLSEIHRMGERQAHRGISRIVWSVSSTIHFGQTFSAQCEGVCGPPVNPIAFSGFIDNRESVAVLLGDNRRAGSKLDDAGLVFDLYRTYGPEGFRHLSGQFALAIWDDRRRRLMLARDAWASCPLFVTQVNGRYLFASEYKALLAIESVPAKPNRDAIQHIHCTKYVSPNACCLADIFPVPGGTWLELDLKGKRMGRYQTLEIDVPKCSDEDHAAALRQSFLEAVRRQTKSFNRVGVSLSGGLDSAVTVAAVRHVRPDIDLHTFTAGFGLDDGDVAEAEVVARHFNTSHHETFLSTDDLPSLMLNTLWHMEDPIGREEKLFYYITAQEAAKHVPVLFAGHNADALFGGMPRHLIVKLAAMVPFLNGPLEEFYRYTQTGRQPRSLLAKTLVAYYFKGKQIEPPQVIGASKMSEGAGFYHKVEQPISEILRRGMLNDPNANSAIERIHAAFGVTFNSPFLDSDLVQTSFRIPDRLKIKGKHQKYILRQACVGLIPDEILNRKKGLLRLKHDQRFCDVLDALAMNLLSYDAVAARGLFELNYVERIRKRPQGGIYPEEQIYRLWSLVLTEMWARIFIDHRGDVPKVSFAA